MQKGPIEGLLVINTDTKGQGVITEHDIGPDVFVCEYAGEVIGREVAKARFTKQVIVTIIETRKKYLYSRRMKVLTTTL